MGRQVNFWMVESDEREFVKRLASDDVVWTPRTLKLGDTPKIYELSDWEPVNHANNLIMIRRADWSKLCYQHISESPLSRDGFTPWTMVGCDSSPCFQWNTCSRENNIIRRGRIYLETGWWADGLTYNKDDELIKWFNRLTGWIKRRGAIGRFSKHYVMPHAQKLAAERSIEFKA